MFKKPHDVSVSSKSLMRGKDAKILREKITALMPASSVPTDEAGSPIDILLPVHGKNSVELTKFAAKFSGYGIPDERIPFFLDLDSKGQLLRLMPTLHGLWRCPNLVPLTFLIPSAVSVPIIGGADVMLPGILVPRGGLPPFKKGVTCTIRVAGNPAPIAVGETLLDRSDAVAAGMRGRGIRVIHHYGDALWDAGGRVRPNDGFRGNMVAPIQREEGFEDEDVEGGDDAAADASAAAAAAAAAPTGSVADADLASATSQLAAATISSPDVSVPADTTSHAVVTSNQDDGDDAAATTSGAGGGAGEDAPESEAAPRTPWWRSLEPDALVTAVFLQAIRRHVKASDLPMLNNVLYGTAMQSARPRDIDLDIRKTKWKKVAPFLHSMAEAGVVGIEEDKAKGTMRITGVDKQHPMVKAHRPWPAAEESGAADGEDSEGEDGAAGASSSPAGPTWLPPVVVQYLRPHPAAALVMNTSMAVLVAKGKGGVLPGTLVHKGRRRGGPVTAQALGTVLLKVAELGIGDDGEGSRAAGPSSSSSDAPTLASILSSLPPATSLLLSRPEAAGLVAEYCSARKLADPTNKKNVLLDDALAGALAGRMARVEDVAMATTTTAATPSTAAAGKGNSADDGYGTLSTAAGAGTKEDEADLDGQGGVGDGHAVDDGGHDEGGDDDGDGSTRPPLPCLPFTPASLSSLACPQSTLLDAPSIPREDVAKLFLSKMEKWYSVTYRQGGSGGVAEVIVKRGEPPSVTIAVKRIQGGRRATTHCINADAYRVDLQDLGRTLQRVLAASATVQPCAQNPKLREVMVQGDESARVAEVLTSQYGVPVNCVRVEEDDGGAKGKGGGGGNGKAGKK